MNDSNEVIQPGSPEIKPKRPVKVFIFWRRLIAFAVDWMILGVVCFMAGLLFHDTLAQLGPCGRIVGFIIAVLYFGIFNSSIGKGATPGKRALGVKVVDANGYSLGTGKSLIRACILLPPIFLNGASIPFSLLMSSIGVIIGFLLFGLGGALIYLFLFNRRTRQCPHDLMVGSYVIRASVDATFTAKKMAKVHYFVVGGLLIVVCISMISMRYLASSKEPFVSLFETAKTLESTQKVYVNRIVSGRSFSPKGGTTYLEANFVWRGRGKPGDEFLNEMAGIILDSNPEVEEKDFLSLSVLYGWNLGLASVWHSHHASGPPAKWRELIIKDKASFGVSRGWVVGLARLTIKRGVRFTPPEAKDN